MERFRKLFIAVFLLSLSVFIAHFVYVGDGVWGDARYYYSYVRSFVMDRDLNFENEYKYFKAYETNYYDGKLINKFSFGAPLLWLPWFVIAHVLVVLLNLFGFVFLADGYSFVYQFVVGFGCVVYGVLGLFFSYLVLRRWFDEMISLLAVLGFYFSSNLFFYIAIDPINSHSTSFFVSSLLMYLVVNNYKKFKNVWLLVMGFLVGLLGLIRLQDVILGIPVALILLASCRDKNSMLLNNVKSFVGKLCILIFGVLCFLMLQLYMWWIIYGSVSNPYLLHGEKFNWLKPQMFNVLFSFNHGLLPYSPIVLVGLIGLVLLIKQKKLLIRNLAVCGGMLFLIQLYIVACWHSWWGGEAYGSRMFISIYPWILIGLGFVLEKLRGRFGRGKVVAMLSLFVLINFGSIVWYLLGS